MAIGTENSKVLAIKDEEVERPIPTAWRPTIREIVRAFVREDYQLSGGVSGVAPVSPETAEQISKYIQDYGAKLIELSEETWVSSVCIWMGNRWDVLVDLWTVSEGRSDLVLSLQISEVGSDYEFSIYMIYVP